MVKSNDDAVKYAARLKAAADHLRNTGASPDKIRRFLNSVRPDGDGFQQFMDDAPEGVPTKEPESESNVFVRMTNQWKDKTKPIDTSEDRWFPPVHSAFAGMPVVIENLKGTVRRGEAPDGTQWATVAPVDYGEFPNVDGVDGDPLDVYIGPNKESQKVFIIDQVDPDSGEFDEHKVMVGFGSLYEALDAYHKAFNDGKSVKRVGDVTPMSLGEFRIWKDSDRTQVAAAATSESFATGNEAYANRMRSRMKFVNNLIKAGDYARAMGVKLTNARMIRERFIQMERARNFSLLNDGKIRNFTPAMPPGIGGKKEVAQGSISASGKSKKCGKGWIPVDSTCHIGEQKEPKQEKPKQEGSADKKPDWTPEQLETFETEPEPSSPEEQKKPSEDPDFERAPKWVKELLDEGDALAIQENLDAVKEDPSLASEEEVEYAKKALKKIDESWGDMDMGPQESMSAEGIEWDDETKAEAAQKPELPGYAQEAIDSNDVAEMEKILDSFKEHKANGTGGGNVDSYIAQLEEKYQEAIDKDLGVEGWGDELKKAEAEEDATGVPAYISALAKSENTDKLAEIIKDTAGKPEWKKDHDAAQDALDEIKSKQEAEHDAKTPAPTKEEIAAQKQEFEAALDAADAKNQSAKIKKEHPAFKQFDENVAKLANKAGTNSAYKGAHNAIKKLEQAFDEGDYETVLAADKYPTPKNAPQGQYKKAEAALKEAAQQALDAKNAAAAKISADPIAPDVKAAIATGSLNRVNEALEGELLKEIPTDPEEYQVYSAGNKALSKAHADLTEKAKKEVSEKLGFKVEDMEHVSTDALIAAMDGDLDKLQDLQEKYEGIADEGGWAADLNNKKAAAVEKIVDKMIDDTVPADGKVGLQIDTTSSMANAPDAVASALIAGDYLKANEEYKKIYDDHQDTFNAWISGDYEPEEEEALKAKVADMNQAQESAFQGIKDLHHQVAKQMQPELNNFFMSKDMALAYAQGDKAAFEKAVEEGIGNATAMGAHNKLKALAENMVGLDGATPTPADFSKFSLDKGSMAYKDAPAIVKAHMDAGSFGGAFQKMKDLGANIHDSIEQHDAGFITDDDLHKAKMDYQNAQKAIKAVNQQAWDYAKNQHGIDYKFDAEMAMAIASNDSVLIKDLAQDYDPDLKEKFESMADGMSKGDMGAWTGAPSMKLGPQDMPEVIPTAMAEAAEKGDIKGVVDQSSQSYNDFMDLDAQMKAGMLSDEQALDYENAKDHWQKSVSAKNQIISSIKDKMESHYALDKQTLNDSSNDVIAFAASGNIDALEEHIGKLKGDLSGIEDQNSGYAKAIKSQVEAAEKVKWSMAEIDGIKTAKAKKVEEIKKPRKPKNEEIAKQHKAAKQDLEELQKAKSVGIQKIDDWQKIGSHKGEGTGGYKMKAPNGDEYFVKAQKTPNHAKNEYAASKLYELGGVPTLNPQLVEEGGTLKTASKWQEEKPLSIHKKADKEAAQKHFAMHAWLANRDAAGNNYENQAYFKNPDGSWEMKNVEAGGAMIYKGMGTPKPGFGDDAKEWDSMRDSQYHATKLFGGMTKKQLQESASALMKIDDGAITDTLLTHGPGTDAEKKALAAKMIKRKYSILQKAGLVDKKNNLTDAGKPFAEGTAWAPNQKTHASGATPEPEMPADPKSKDPNDSMTGSFIKPSMPSAPIYDGSEPWHEKYNKLSNDIKAFADKGDLKGLKDYDDNHMPSKYTKAGKLKKKPSKVQTYLNNCITALENAQSDAQASGKQVSDVVAPAPAPAASTPVSGAKKKAAKKKAAPKVKPFKFDFAKEVSGGLKKPDFANWHGTGSPLHKSKPELNAINQKLADQLEAMAQKGDIEGIKKFEPGKSSHVTSYKDSILSHYESQKSDWEWENMPKPPSNAKGATKEVGNRLKALKKVPKVVNNKNDVGRYSLLGKMSEGEIEGIRQEQQNWHKGGTAFDTLHGLKANPAYKAGKVSDMRIKNGVSLATKALDQMKAVEWSGVQTFTGGGYKLQAKQMNEKQKGSTGAMVGKAIHKYAQDIPEGTILSRKINISGKELEDFKKSGGLVLQDTAAASYSADPAVWDGNVRLHIRVPKGVKGVWVGDKSDKGRVSSYKSEREMIMPPGQRVAITDVVDKGNGVVHIVGSFLPYSKDQCCDF